MTAAIRRWCKKLGSELELLSPALQDAVFARPDFVRAVKQRAAGGEGAFERASADQHFDFGVGAAAAGKEAQLQSEFFFCARLERARPIPGRHSSGTRCLTRCGHHSISTPA